MNRRALLLGAAALAAPRIGRASEPRVLRFVPYVDVAVLDPVVNTNAVTRTHSYLIFDTLFATDGQFQLQPQMAAGFTADLEFRDTTITLRDGLRFHDGTPVLGRDVVASLMRWGKRDVFGLAVFEAMDDISAPTDSTIRIRMKRPFRRLIDALGKMGPNMPAIMPERLARTDPFKNVPELIGSGPFRFVPGDRIPGAKLVYEKFTGYVPRQGGGSGFTAGPKIAQVDRVEWLTMPEPATAMAALQRGEVDWLETPSPDLLPRLRASHGIKVETMDTTGQMVILRFNTLIPPFDNPKLRRAVLRAVDQSEFMRAYADDESLWRVGVGVFTGGTPFATKAGLDGLFGQTDFARARAEVAASGYQNETVVLLAPTDHPVSGPVANVAADLFRKIGLKVDLQTMDSGTVFQRRNSRATTDKGGWNVFPAALNGLGQLNPGESYLTRGNGLGAWYGWPTSPAVETLHDAYLAAESVAEQHQICDQLQIALMDEAPFAPVGQVVSPTAYRSNITGIDRGFPRFWGISKS